MQSNAPRARVAIYDVAGRLVHLLLDESRPAGRHQQVWSGDYNRGKRVASGVYLYKL